ncbi:MAG: 4-(cytidine 5'-diphospho)-2-C-methyl-D-erythritol kinase [Planctomycetes bacterium]|nr:4-(cytidine 5'-diphospho)-2-C-methyl-D-erythritol kinase [Planctomycetota bacterium]
MERLAVKSYAKLNLFLEICKKRKDGFHEIESIFQEIDLADELRFSLRQDGAINLDCDNPEIPTGDSNLVLRAARRLQAESGVSLGADIELCKRIPVGGGLGGGSGNAAATLQALNFLWDAELPEETLESLAGELGSDVVFFLHGGACLCRGRGELVEPLAASLELEAVLIIPEWGISSEAAYQALTPGNFGARSAKDLVEAIMARDISRLAANCFNRFENVVFKMEPRQGQLFKRLHNLGFDALRMSGSGSTLFCIVTPGQDPARMVKQAQECKGVARALLVKNAPPRTI